MSQPFDNRDYDVQKLAEKDAEIERLQGVIDALELDLSNALGDSQDKDAQIERLNGELLDQTDRRHWLTNENESLKSLIGELADALSYYPLLDDFEKSLLERAREATK